MVDTFGDEVAVARREGGELAVEELGGVDITDVGVAAGASVQGEAHGVLLDQLVVLGQGLSRHGQPEL